MSTPQRLIAAARRRIRRRHVLRAAVVGGWFGVGLAVVALGVSRLWWPLPAVPPWTVAVGLAAAAVIVGAIVGRMRPILSERELALLIDRALGTDEVLVTLLHLEESGKAPPAVQQDLERRVATLPSVARGVQAGPPRHAWLVPVAAVLAALLLLVPQREAATAAGSQDTDLTDVEQEAERLEDALEDISEEGEDVLPEDIQEGMDELMKDLEDGKLSKEEAQERIAELQEELAEWEESLEEATTEDSEALEEAADALREGDAGDQATEEAMEQLADALEEQDMEAAADAVESLQDKLEGASSEQQEKLGEALERAGEALKGAGSEDLKSAGDALEQAGQQMQEQAGQQGEGDSQGEQAGDSARETLDKLREQLGEGSDLAERMKRDQERLKKSQEVNGALEASRQRMGGEAGVEEGEQGEQAQQGGPCTPEDMAAGRCVNASGEPCTPDDMAAGNCTRATSGGSGGGEPGVGLGGGMPGEEGPATAGTGHTWEDEGTHDTVGGHQDENRQNGRTEGELADDFESFYDPVRMEGAEGLVTKVEGKIDEDGHIDSLPTRRTDGDETAKVRLLDVPDQYVDAADEALANERVPPGYRDAVKDYFDSME